MLLNNPNSGTQTERPLYNGLSELKDLLSSIDEVIFIADAYNFELLYANDACYKVYGYTAEEIMADKNIFLSALHPDDKETFYNSYMEVHEKGSAVHEFRVIHKDGTIKTLKAHTELKKGSGEHQDVLRGITIDITDLREAEQKLREQYQQIKLQNEKLKEISWIQCHKVRSPLANILGLTKLFNYQDPADPNNLDVLHAFKISAEQLDGVIAEINKTAAVSGLFQ